MDEAAIDGEGDARKELKTIARNESTRKSLLQDLERAESQLEDARSKRDLAMEFLEANQLYRKLTEAMSEGVATLSNAGVILFCNPAFAELLRCPVGDVTGRDLKSFVAAKDQDVLQTMLARGATGKAKGEISMQLPDQSGSVPVLLSVFQLGGAANLPALGLIATDLSALKRAETEQRATEEQDRQSQKMEAVGRLASGVAHDFNNFLTAINGFSAFLLDQVDKASPLRPGLLEIMRAGDRAATLTRQLLAFGRKQAQKPVVVDVNAVISEMHLMLHRLIGEDVQLLLHLDPKCGSVLFDPGQLEQIVLNLSLNARDAMPKGGKLIIESQNVEADSSFRDAALNTHPEDVKPFVLLKFIDTGVGMSPEVRDRMFEPFFTTKKSGKGTGLGLSTVYGIVKQREGHIAILSEPGKGSIFQVFLPRLDTRVRAPRRAQGRAWPAQYRGGETILLVEDESSVRRMARDLLSGNGYKVLEACDGFEALEISRGYAGEIHLLLTDVVMPNMNGRQLAEKLQPLRPGMRILYTSGYADDAIVQCGIREGESALLPKPFTSIALAQKVREQLDEARSGAWRRAGV